MEAMDSVGCDWLLNDLGPPPDAILQIPPPPFPHFIDRNYLHEIAVAGIGDFNKENDTTPCHWCHWARRLDLVGSISVASGTEMALEDTWFFIILASCLMLTLGALLSGLIYWRINGKTLKGSWDFGSFFAENNSILIGNNDTGISPIGGGRHHNGSVLMPAITVSSHRTEDLKLDCQAICSSDDLGEHFLRNCHRIPAAQRQVTTPSSFPPLTRALWAGVKTCAEGNHYTITHAQPFDQKQKRSSLSPTILHDLEQPDEDSTGYTTLHLCATTSALTVPNAENQMYYSCTDVIVIPQPYTSSAVQPVTSLDDSTDPTCEDTQNPLYVNMSPLHSLSSPKISYPLINPIYPSPCRSQQTNSHFNNSLLEETIIRNNQTITHQMNSSSHFK